MRRWECKRREGGFASHQASVLLFHALNLSVQSQNHVLCLHVLACLKRKEEGKFQKKGDGNAVVPFAGNRIAVEGMELELEARFRLGQ